MARCCLLLGLGAWTCVAAKALPLASAANAQVQLRCDDPLLETRGAAQLKRSTSQLSVSLGRDAEAGDAEGAPGMLLSRLAAVRSALKRLEARELRVTSPSS
ncbi:MAG: hypothetical protein RLZZ611_46 [Cyanobacteriota bacterium]|jgi:uncharacterized protein YggE